MRVLLVEDEAPLAASLKEGLEDQGWVVDHAADGEDALAFARTYPYDVIVLDWGLPKLDGAQVCARMRQDGIRSGIIMLTCRDSLDDRVRGLDSGADDYLVKPVHLRELLARLRAQLRRESNPTSSCLRLRDLELDPRTAEVRRGGAEITLTRKEFLILHALMKEPGRVLSMEDLLDRAWPADAESDPQTVRTHIKSLRRKLDAHGPGLIRTVHGLGYKIE